MLNKTKIICTIGAQSASEATIEEMLLSGMNVARLNFRNGEIAIQQRYIELLKKVALIHGRPLAIMLDTCGPKIRAHQFEGDIVNVAKGCKVSIKTNKEILGTANSFSINNPDLFDQVEVGQTILANEGKLKLLVISKNHRSKEIVCEAQKSGILANNCQINVPQIQSTLPYISDNDLLNVEFAVKTNLDFIGASFVRRKEDVEELRNLLQDRNSNIKILAKIENKEAVDNFDEILQASDGIIISRGDLSIELPLEDIPVLQKKMIRKANQVGKPIIVATQILSSMTRNKVPSRAEVADVANLVLDGVDGLSLSNVTTIGQYPTKAVATLARILSRTEMSSDELSHFGRRPHMHFGADETLDDAVALAVKDTAKVVNAKLIVAFSESGATAKRISRLRPNCPIATVTSSDDIRLSLTLNWGIYPVVSVHPTCEIDFVNKASEVAVYYGLKEGDTFVITGGSGKGNTNFMKVCKL